MFINFSNDQPCNIHEPTDTSYVAIALMDSQCNDLYCVRLSSHVTIDQRCIDYN